MDISHLKYPIYIVSKGRSKTQLTANVFLKENIRFLIAVEPQEFASYAKHIDKMYLLKLPFSNLGLGSYPARNYCWQHSLDKGFNKHYIFDDNIRAFVRLNNGKRQNCSALQALNCLEAFTDRFSGVAISGFNYRFFVTKETTKPFSINTHVYSAMLINNHIPYKWRLKYNEDVDICLQSLHGGFNTILLNAFLVDKVSTTVKMAGGNQTELYCNNDFEKKVLKAKSLEQIWPQYVKTTFRFGRPHHQVSWNKHFKHPLKKRIT